MKHDRSTLTLLPRNAFLLGCILLFLTPAGGVSLFAEDLDSSIRFSWAFLYQGKDGVTRPIDYDKRVVRLKSGDKLKIYLKPLDACHIYLYLYDAQKDLFLLFPEAFDRSTRSDANPRITKNFELPGVNSWYSLDEQLGVETFYLIVSARHLEGLEERTEQYFNGLRNGSRHRQIINYKHGVLDEIKRLLKESSYLSDAAGKPVAVAGDFRGIREERDLNGVHIEAAEVYVKTIRLAH
jgi:hypothetical protein